MTREEMENAIVDDYVKMIIRWVENSDDRFIKRTRD